MPIPVSETRTTAVPASSADASVIRPPGGVYLAALLSRLATTCVSRVMSPSTTIPGTGPGSMTSSWRPASISGRLVSTALRNTVASSIRSRRSSSLPCEMRLTSSRSSTRWMSWCSWRSIISRAATCVFSSRRQTHDLERVADRRERIAQLVGERGDEDVLPPVGLAQRLGGDTAFAVGDLALGHVARDREDRADTAVGRDFGDQPRLEVPDFAARRREREARLDDLPGLEHAPQEAIPLGAELGRHARLGVRLGEERDGGNAGVGLDQRADVGVAQRAVEAGEDERRVLDQHRELVLAARELSHRDSQRRRGPVALADVATDDQPAGGGAVRIAQRGQGRLDVHLDRVAAHVHGLAAPRSGRAQLGIGALAIVFAVPADAVEPLERMAERRRRLEAVLALGRGVQVDQAAAEVDGDDGVLHLREHVAAQPVRRRVGRVERVDRVVDDERVDLARADRLQRLLGFLELDAQRGQLARVLRVGSAARTWARPLPRGPLRRRGGEVEAAQDARAVGHVADELALAAAAARARASARR